MSWEQRNADFCNAQTDAQMAYIEAEREVDRLQTENAKLREQLERVQPTDCEGNALDIADTVHMLRSEYDGDHEWEDVVTELVLTKWGGDRWIVRGSKGEAWACDCTKTGYDEDAYEASDDVEPFDEPTLLEVENAKLRELVRDAWGDGHPDRSCEGCDIRDECHNDVERMRKDGMLRFSRCLFELRIEERMRELGIRVNDCE